jgi:hypothetical protein
MKVLFWVFDMMRKFWNLLIVAVFCLFFMCAACDTAKANDDTPKILYVIIEDERLIASNTSLSRFDEIKLTAEEIVLQKVEANAVAVIVTNKRIIGYAVFLGSWKPLRYQAGEKVLSVEAEDFSAFVLTSDRFLNFNGKHGLWAQTER